MSEHDLKETLSTPGEAFNRLCRIMEQLRSPAGCPWDARQTPESLKPYILEEAYELIEAIDLKDLNKICEELGDLLLQIVFQASIFSEQKQFTATDVANGIADKLIRRHPHVFADGKYDTEDDLHRQWEEIKKREAKGTTATVYDNIPRTLPALARAQKLIRRAQREGDPLPHPAATLDSVATLGNLSGRDRELAIGAHLAAVIHKADQVGCDAETALLSWVEENLKELRQNPSPNDDKDGREDKT